MYRRTFLSYLALVSTSFAVSCTKKSMEKSETAILKTQDQLFNHYSKGLTGDIVAYLDHDFSFVDGSIVGNRELFRRRLGRLNMYHSKKGMLPLGVSNRVANIVGEIGWVACEVTAAPESSIYGLLTQIFMRHRNGKWMLVRHHFSGQSDFLSGKKM